MKNGNSFKCDSYVKKNEKERVFILGAKGQLGSDFQKYFKLNKIQYMALGHDELDIKNEDRIKDIIKDNKFTVMINCAAYNDVDKAENDKKACYELNAYVPGKLANLCNEYGVSFITYSSDFVFDGKKITPYSEEDEPSPLSEYAKSKLSGEKLILSSYKNSYVIRTSWVFGLGNNNFCKQIIKWSRLYETLRIVGDQVSAPTYSKDLAEYSWLLYKKGNPGLYHISNSGETSKYLQAKYILKKIKWSGKLELAKTTDFEFDAQRPPYSKLDSSKAEDIIGKPMPHWKDAINRFIIEMSEIE